MRIDCIVLTSASSWIGEYLTSSSLAQHVELTCSHIGDVVSAKCGSCKKGDQCVELGILVVIVDVVLASV